MSKRDKYKLLSIPIAAFAGIFSCMFGFSLLTLQPDMAITILIIVYLLAMLVIGAILYHSRFWKHWPPTRKSILSWLIITPIVVVLISVNLWTLIEAYRVIELQNFGVQTEAVIVDRWTETNKGSEYHRFTYKWEVVGENSQRIAFSGQDGSSLGWSSHTRPGTKITIRYLKENPAISRVEEDFADLPVNTIMFFLFSNLFAICIGPVYFWLEQHTSVPTEHAKAI